MRKIIHVAIILTFTLGIIAPACGFSWSKNKTNFIEICTSNGIEKIALNSNEPPQTPSQGAPHQEQCPFCFAHTHLTADLNAFETTTINFTFTSNQYFSQYQTALKAALKQPYQSRAPPSFV